MFRSIVLRFTETDDIALTCKGITIFVGPNNAGKSLVLREIEQAFHVHPFPSGLRILVDYEVEWPSLGQIVETIKNAKAQPAALGVPEGQIVIGGGFSFESGNRVSATLDEKYLLSMVNHKIDKASLATQFLKLGVIRLDGRSRFILTNDQSAGDLLGPPKNLLTHLFQDDAARNNVRALVKDAFGLYFLVDPTNLGKLRIRLSDTPPTGDEQSLNDDAREYYRKAVHIKDASDGVQAFTGIVAAVRSGDFHTILVDEPEAFLHPPLARKLGKNLAELVADRGGSLMASTHSSDFLMGCLQASPDVRVVRLEYSAGKSRGRMIDPNQLEMLFKHPLMRSANVISGLFHDGVVVVESDNDRAFYAEIYHRLSEVEPNYPSILFINAQNKQTTKDILGPLRQFGVPAAAIVDIDIVKEGGSAWTDWLSAAQVPLALHAGYGQQRASINVALVATGKNMKRDGGLRLLTDGNREAAEVLLSNLEAYGLFAVPGGELECWLPNLGVSGRKTDWAINMLNRLGADPKSSDYVKPTGDDVWQFLRAIVAWIRNSSRKGTA